jgi:quercetin dioxygenase-like cupin family protein
MNLYRWAEVPKDHLSPGITRQMVVGERAMLCRFRYAPGTREPVHAHESEQFSYVLEGRVRFLLEGRQLEAGPGEIVYIPSRVPHGAEVLGEDAEVIEVFSPLRPDFLDRARG